VSIASYWLPGKGVRANSTSWSNKQDESASE
jgi:hypothetical protein